MTLTKATYSMIQGAPINVLDYGADPTGASNSSAAFTAAIAAAPNSGVIDIPSGSYLLATEIAINKPLTINFNGATLTSAAEHIFTITSSGVFLNGDYAQITHTGTGVAIRTNPPSNTNYTNVEAIRISIAGSASGAGGVLFRNVHYGRVDAFLSGYTAGYGVTLEGHPTGDTNDFAMRCVVESTCRIEDHLYGVILGGVNGPANANEVHARITSCTVGVTWIIGRPNYISNANIEFCQTGIDGSTHTPDGVLTVIGCNFENNTTDITNANSANTRIAVYQSDIFSVSDPGQMMIISNMGAASGVNTSLRIQQWGEGFRYTAPPFSAIPTSTFGGNVFVGTLSGAGGQHIVGTTSTDGGITGATPSVVAHAYNATSSAQILKSTGATYHAGLIWNSATAGDNAFFQFGTEGTYTARGSITYNRGGGQVAFNTTSDYRAKDIVGPVKDSGATIDALKVYTGKMKCATIERPMLIAHEAQEVVPYAVTGKKDAVDANENPVFQQIDVSSLVPLLLAEIQSLRTRVSTLEK